MPGNWKVQAYTTDPQRNIYLTSIQNGYDTIVSIVSKYSPDGELLWKTSVLPVLNDKRFNTRFDWTGKMYVDIDSNLVVIVAGYDSLGYSVHLNYKRFMLLTKFSMNGQMISNKIDYIANYRSSIEHLGDIDIQPNGDIIVSHDGINNLHHQIFISKYNKNFDSLFSCRLTLNLVI